MFKGDDMYLKINPYRTDFPEMKGKLGVSYNLTLCANLISFRLFINFPAIRRFFGETA